MELGSMIATDQTQAMHPPTLVYSIGRMFTVQRDQCMVHSAAGFDHDEVMPCDAYAAGCCWL
jgi:hypothetical protein